MDGGLQSRLVADKHSGKWMDRFEALRIFHAAAESQNFREAAFRLGVSPQVITRVVKQLEKAFGEPLFHRNTRGVRLTHFGEQLAQKSAQAIAEVEDIFSSAATSANDDPSGTVRIAAPSMIARRLVRDLAPVLARHPGLIVDIRISDVLANAVDEQIDIGIRCGDIQNSGFVAKAVSQGWLHFVCAPDLLKRITPPENKKALLKAPLTVLIDRNSGRPSPWIFGEGDRVTPAQPVFVTDDQETECEAVLAGVGIAQMASALVLPLLREGRLVSLLPDLRPAPSPLHLYRPQRTPVPSRVRVIFDALSKILSDH